MRPAGPLGRSGSGAATSPSPTAHAANARLSGTIRGISTFYAVSMPLSTPRATTTAAVATSVTILILDTLLAKLLLHP